MVKSIVEQKKVTKSSGPGVAAAAMIKKKFKGVRMRSWGSWVSEIRAPNQKARIWLGSHSSPESAARAYDAALLCLRGAAASATLNFPLRLASYYIPPSDAVLSPKSIQRIAAAAAAGPIPTPPPAFPPSCSGESPPLWEAASFEDGGAAPDNPAPAAIMACSWYNLDSPKYMFMNEGLLDPPELVDHLNEDFGDIRLWSFN
ncbi:unnamed protein product [Cuscuta epithymum]|uniref:AP2/ERF domain-containing protein n=1 Tax=Cuscuta epithymum TaxID=186058 RepID=A0AAV0CRI6_9ASTE|nr:unnamed protein product [Cuscuta epithymum]